MDSSFDNKNTPVNLPNTLSVIRLIFIPVVVIFLYIPGRTGGLLAALFFVLASITDLLDGFYARRYNTVTSIGKLLDPLADKLLISVTLIILIELNRISALIVALIIAREIAITGLRGLAVSRGKVIAASRSGKYKTIFQIVAITCLCLHYQYLNIDFHVVGVAFIWAALLLTIWSGFLYFKRAKNMLL